MDKQFKKLEPSDECIGKAFQMDDYGNFRIVIHGFKSGWTNYRGIATLEYDGRLYGGVSAFYEGSLPHECVFEIVKTNILSSEEQSPS